MGQKKHQPVGICDVGSNAVRLVVYDRLARSPVTLVNQKTLCGLGRGLAETGNLNAGGVEQALTVLRRYRLIASGLGVKQLEVICTAATRDAADGPAFLARIKKETGLQPRIISGEEEAALGALGVLAGLPGASGVMADLGGGSLELVSIDNGKAGRGVALKMGVLRLLAVPKAKRVAEIEAALKGQPALKAMRGQALIAVGGSWRTIAKLYMEDNDYPLHIVDHLQIRAGQMAEYCRYLAGLSPKKLATYGARAKKRLDTLPGAALLMAEVIRLGKPAEVIFSAGGVREGSLFQRLSRAEQKQDPLLAAAQRIAEDDGRFGLAPELMPWLQPLKLGEAPLSPRLVQAACLLSDCSWSDHPDYRDLHATERVLTLPVIGLDHHERVILALAIAGRYGGTVEEVGLAGPLKLLAAHEILAAERLGHALRLAYTLSGGAMVLLKGSSLRLTRKSLVLTVPRQIGPEVVEGLAGRLASLAKTYAVQSELLVLA